MSKYKAKDLEEVHVVLTRMRKDGEVTDHKYYRSMVSLAAQWAEIGELGESVALIQNVPPSYFGRTLCAQLKEDSIFCEAALYLTDKLVAEGYAQEIGSTGENPEEILLACAQVGRA